MNDHLELELDGLKFDAGKSIRYHSHLRSFWSKADHINKVLMVFLGTSVAFSALQKWPNAIIITGLLTALFSSFDIVFGFSEKARVYDDLYKRWNDYLSDLESIAKNSLDDHLIITGKQKRLKIERDEPGIFRLMERFSAAEEAAALGRDIHSNWKLNPFSKNFCRLLG